MEQAFAAARDVAMLGNAQGVEPEKVLVLETVGRVEDFFRALRGLAGLEWLTEWDEYDIPPEPDLFFDREKPDKQLSGRLYLLMSNQQGMRDLLSLWQKFRVNPEDPGFAWGKGRWRNMFLQLREIRPWDFNDRLFETGIIEDWQERLAAGEERVRVEVELWFRGNPQLRQRASNSIRQAAEELGGELISEAVIEGISYHALLLELPIEQVGTLLEGGNARLAYADQVMYFRPVGQSAVPALEGEPASSDGPEGDVDVAGSPVIALLDGLPSRKPPMACR
ncbi:hypothetical protein [Longimicrobium terrae]|uniref:Uncharacterized protein n=1 Tax=Longimicrobium terrae TaxID=1639882 RepID=A0A841H5Z4_9BACT|nr:hypothetical protein [Longimicrobium terrae]MBB4639257.1 hypothetical protein [Longimicrobium terrae]MBB6073497.1 hypothetical protein [Longimicrobium terrae]NNC32253.1 hypothetical protein [Longimicrobium terrae]